MSDVRTRGIVCAAVGLALLQVAAAFCGCRKPAQRLTETKPTPTRAWADPKVLARHHPMWREYELMVLMAEQEPGTPGSPAAPAGSHPKGASEQEASERPDLDEWSRMARQTVRGTATDVRGPQDLVSAEAVEEADARLEGRREAIAKATMEKARAAESDVVDERFTRASALETDRAVAEFGPGAGDGTHQERVAQVNGDAEGFVARRAKEKEARIRADAAKQLHKAEQDREAEVLDARKGLESRPQEEPIDVRTERQHVSGFVTPAGKPQGQSTPPETARMMRREGELADTAQKLHEEFASASNQHATDIRAGLDGFRERLVEDTRRLAYTLAKARGIDLTFEPEDGRVDMTDEVCDLVQNAYAAPSPEVNTEAFQDDATSNAF